MSTGFLILEDLRPFKLILLVDGEEDNKVVF